MSLKKEIPASFRSKAAKFGIDANKETAALLISGQNFKISAFKLEHFSLIDSNSIMEI